MRINEIKIVLSQLYFLKKTLKKYRKVLKKGNYYMFLTMRAMTLNEQTSMNKAKRYFDKKVPNSVRTSLVHYLNELGFYKNRAGSDNGYDAFYVANNYDKTREIKLFSFDRRKILTICANSTDFKNQTDWYEKMHTSYNMPRIEKSPLFDNSYEISMIDVKPRPDEIYALSNILSSTMENNREKVGTLDKASVSEFLFLEYENDEMNQILQGICSKISPDALDLDISLCEQHGDLSRDNLLYGTSDEKTCFWWIDWEHLKERPFFYDYFFYILNTAMYFHDKTALHAYFNGDNNEELKKCFGFFGTEFSCDRLKDYFLIFAVVFLKERVCDKGNLYALKMYYDFINEIIS